jgi:hypothetical protein
LTAVHTGGVRARWVMTCECCKATIDVGSRFVMFHGRPWIPDHALAYIKKRRSLAASG